MYLCLWDLLHSPFLHQPPEVETELYLRQPNTGPQIPNCKRMCNSDDVLGWFLPLWVPSSFYTSSCHRTVTFVCVCICMSAHVCAHVRVCVCCHLLLQVIVQFCDNSQLKPMRRHDDTWCQFIFLIDDQDYICMHACAVCINQVDASKTILDILTCFGDGGAGVVCVCVFQMKTNHLLGCSLKLECKN